MIFGSLVVLHAWLHSYLCFSLLENPFLSNLDTSRYLAYLTRFLVDFLSQSRHLSIARWIDRESSCSLDSFLTPLDLSRSSYMYCFSYVLHLSVILSSITSCFITFMHFYGFLFAPLIIFDHLYVSWVKFCSFLYPLSIMTKRERKCGFFLRFYMLGGEIHAFVRGSCVSSC